MRQDFNEFDNTIQTGAIVMTILIAIIISLSIYAYSLSKDVKTLYIDNLKQEQTIKEINKICFDRFVIANDLTEICNRFQSSRKAKEEYYLNN